MRSSSVLPVVVGVDGSESSMSAVRAAAAFASRYGLPLRVVHVFNWLPDSPRQADPQPGTTAHELLERAVAAASTVAPDLAVSTRLLEGAPGSTLLRQARTASLLAVGDGGLSGHVCLPTQAGAVHVAARASCSVLVARARHPFGGSVVVGVNGSPASEQALDFAFDTAARRGTDLLVVRAVPTADDPAGDRLPDLAELVAVREDKYRVPARARTVPGDPATILIAASQGASLLIVGARGQHAYGGLLGSVSQTVLHHSCAPLILVRGLIAPPPDRYAQSPVAAATG
ncbi:universal stress protein [Actinoplanes sp. NPDC048967]|uniref:universal stress protein n=1 Tax=Actinoplanes sp. NPDC048967 TaxID=3155269 RepID=UPI0034043290